MDKPIEEMSFEEIEAERTKIAAERAALARDLANRAPNNTVRELYEGIDQAPEVLAEIFASPADDDNKGSDAPAPKEAWPHEHLVHHGLELDVRVPNQSALMALSMLQQLNGLGEIQMNIFNSFLANHLSPDSLAKVIGELTRPESEMSVQSLIQALVDLRIELSNAS